MEYLRNLLTKKGYQVLVEPTIATRQGNRKPDLIVTSEADCRIIDVTITADVFNMAGAFDQKVAYYYDEDILRWATEKWPGRLMSTSAVVYNWRGAVYVQSARLLRDLGVSDFELRVMAVRDLTYTRNMFRHFTRSTTSTRTAT